VSVRGWLVISLLVGVFCVGTFATLRLEGSSPTIGEISSFSVGDAGHQLSIELSDAQSGLRRVELRLRHGGGSASLVERSFPGGWITGGAPGTRHQQIDLRVEPRNLGIPDGPATLVVTVRDWSWRDGFAGNRSEREIPLRVDTRPPRIEMDSGLTYIYRGGSAAAVYRVNEATESDGVDVAGMLFRGFPLDEAGERRVAFFAIPIEAPINPVIRVVAADAAGNRGEARFPVRVFERHFAQSEISLSESFLANVVPELAEAHGIDVSEPTRAFQQINTRLRAENEEQIRRLAANSSGQRYWGGSFEQLRSSKVTSRFAERRSYRVADEPISEARHFGFDLASTAAAPVTASNAGVVLFAGDLGIYGNCLLLDHGQGLTSLYGHLSQLDVSTGDRVEKGATLGLSGSTGLAGGDHLHFAILVGGTYVDPLEWWDPKWVQSHVEVRLEAGAR
jgi:murein DD-endopeptidase MepM/ murein hydrolase activator NlpD